MSKAEVTLALVIMVCSIAIGTDHMYKISTLNVKQELQVKK